MRLYSISLVSSVVTASMICWAISANQFYGSCSNRFWGARGIAHDQDGQIKRGAARMPPESVRHVGTGHQVNEGQVILRFDQMDVGDALKDATA